MNKLYVSICVMLFASSLGASDSQRTRREQGQREQMQIMKLLRTLNEKLLAQPSEDQSVVPLTQQDLDVCNSDGAPIITEATIQRCTEEGKKGVMVKFSRQCLSLTGDAVNCFDRFIQKEEFNATIAKINSIKKDFLE